MNDEEIIVYLPFPPTINSYYGCNRNVKYVRKAGKEYRKDARESMIAQLRGWNAFECKLLVEITFFMPDRRARDLDNYKKALLDSCTRDYSDGWEGIWVDDSQIDQDFTYRGQIVKYGLVMMKVYPAGPIIPLPDHLKKMAIN